MKYIGIDPGKRGGIAVIEGGTLKAIEMPIHKSGELDVNHIVMWLLNSDCDGDSCVCALEKAQSMPNQGVKSMFNYGVGYGMLKAILQFLQIPFQEVPPNKWKKTFSLTKKGKDASVLLALHLFPQQELYTKRDRMMDGKAEAILLAEYAKRTFSENY